MAKDKDKLKIDAVEALRKSPNAMHKHHRLNSSGTGAHKSKKRYARRNKYKQEYGEE